MNNKIDPDIVFLDAHNLPEFDTSQFEGKIERPLGKWTIIAIACIACIIFSTFMYRSFALHVVRGNEFLERSERNRLEHTVVFAERGIIFDRNGVPLAWNEQDEATDFSLRRYAATPGISHLTGYVKYPAKDVHGNYYSHEFDPREGVEKLFDESLRGKNGVKLRESDVGGAVLGESEIERPEHGNSVYLSIDSTVQRLMYETIEEAVVERDFEGGAGVLMDLSNGEVIAHVSFPEYSAEIMTNGTGSDIAAQLRDTRNIFLDRATVGVFAPGSIVKPFMAIAALRENIIEPEKSIYSAGRIVIPNPYFPDKPSIFRDWKAHGYTNMQEAIAVSSDVYFYAIGGGYEDQKGLGIRRIYDYMTQFGFGRPMVSPFFGGETGVVPTPEWKEKTFDGDPWRLGDTYHTSIGQFGFMSTPIQALRATAGIATRGTLVEPTIIQGDTATYNQSGRLTFTEDEYRVIEEGMHLAVENGTAIAMKGLPFSVAAKTGTAEVGAQKQWVNSWIIGYYPYERPRYAFVLMMERGPRANTLGAPAVTRRFFEKMRIETPEYVTFSENQ